MNIDMLSMQSLLRIKFYTLPHIPCIAVRSRLYNGMLQGVEIQHTLSAQALHASLQAPACLSQLWLLVSLQERTMKMMMICRPGSVRRDGMAHL